MSENTYKQQLSECAEKMVALETNIRQYERIINSQQNGVSMDASSILSGEDCGSAMQSEAIITVLSNQRERYKKKNHELEEVS
jgi:ADP-ribosylglycohydrolase